MDDDKKETFLEDDFDLPAYKDATFKKIQQKNHNKNGLVLTIFTILMAIFSFIIIYSLYDFLNGAIQHQKLKSQATTATDSAVVVVATSTVAVTSPTAMNNNLATLQTKYNNSDISGNLIWPDGTTTVVVQTVNNTFYVDHNIHKDPSVEGSAFLDSGDNVEKMGQNTVIYGANSDNNTLLGNLKNYADLDYFNNNKIIKLETKKDTTTWQVVAFQELTTKFEYIRPISNDIDFQKYIDNISASSKYPLTETLTKDDKILTLVTNTNSDSSPRYVLYAKQIPDNVD